MKNKLILQVFLAIALGIIAGWAAGSSSSIFGVLWLKIFDLIGQLFLNALNLVVVPLVASSIITGTARIGSESSFGRLGGMTFFYFILTAIVAVAIGTALALFIAPGTFQDTNSLVNTASTSSIGELARQSGSGIFDRIVQILLRLFPSNIIAVASQGQMLGLIFFCIVFGYFSSRIESHLAETMINFWKAAFQIMMKITQLVMRALPIGVFGLMAKVAATTGIEAIKPVMLFFFTVLAGLVVFTCAFLPLLLWFGRIKPFFHIRAVAPALFTAFTTSSSAATLPITLDCMEKRAGVPNKVCSFVLPLGTSINLTGSALYATVAVIFIAQTNGLDLNIAMLVTIFLMGIFSSLGMVAGIPSASLVTIVVILQTIGLASDGIIYILATDRILDMLRTTTSVFGTTCCAALVHHATKNPDHATLNSL